MEFNGGIRSWSLMDDVKYVPRSKINCAYHVRRCGAQVTWQVMCCVWPICVGGRSSRRLDNGPVWDFQSQYIPFFYHLCPMVVYGSHKHFFECFCHLKSCSSSSEPLNAIFRSCVYFSVLLEIIEEVITLIHFSCVCRMNCFQDCTWTNTKHDRWYVFVEAMCSTVFVLVYPWNCFPGCNASNF